MTKPTDIYSRFAPLFFLVFGLAFVTFQQSDFFHAVPGDLGDARFNNLILEHVYRWMMGRDPSLWSPEFFYPYPGSLSFSDNHLGSVLIYAALRMVGASPDYAFIVWYSVAALLNYLCCYYALKKCGLTPKGSATGAFIYAFAFTASAQYGHAQLNYRFAIPLAMLAWRQLSERGDIRYLAHLIVWVTIQFYCSIYLGYFLILLLGASFCASYLVGQAGDTHKRPHHLFYEMVRGSSKSRFVSSILIIVVCVVALAALLYPYMHYSRLYGFHRNKAEIGTMLPRVWSYLIADNSRVWAGLSSKLPFVPMRHEQQMFFGLSAIVLAILGSVRYSTLWVRNTAISLVLLVLLTLSVHKHSLYFLIVHLPVANAIRAVSRIGIVMLFPIGALAGHGYDWLSDFSRPRINWPKMLVCTALTLTLLVEYAAVTTGRVPVNDWRNHLTALEHQVPEDLPKDAILFIPLRKDVPPFMSEVDGMNLGQVLGRTTMNGYSGNLPSGFYNPDVSPCDQAIDRLAGYMNFAKKDKSEINGLLSRVFIAGEQKPCLSNAVQ